MSIRQIVISLSFFIIIFLPFVVAAQNITITGTIRDAHTAEPVAFASVYLLKAGNGGISDSAGNFSVKINPLSGDTLAVSFIGYTIFKVAVSAFGENVPMLIELKRGGNYPSAIVRTKVNKGLYLWKKIMAKKDLYNRYKLDNFGYEAYNKLEIDIKNFDIAKARKNILLKPFSFIFNDITAVTGEENFLPAYLIETMSDYAYQREPRRYYEKIKASNTRGLVNESISKLLGVMNQNVSIYSNFIKVMDKDFISPFHDNATAYYNFSVPDTQMVNGKKIFRFVFRPKRPGQNVFEGDAWVLEKTFQIQKITLYLGKDANINYIDRISVFQEYLPINDSVYFLNRDKFFADFRLAGKKSLNFIGRKTTSYKNIAINSDSITNLLKDQKEEQVIKTNADFAAFNDTAWNRLRHDTLSASEQSIYNTIDKMLKNPKYHRLQNTFKFIGSGYKDIGNVEIGKWYNWVSRNAWEGTRFRFDVGTNKGFEKNLHLHGYLAYGTLDKQVKGKAEALWILKRKPHWTRLHLDYTDDIDNGINQTGQLSQDNIFSIAIRKPNTFRKFVHVKDLGLELYKEWGKGFSTEFFATRLQYNPLKNLPFKYSFPVSSGEALTNFELAVKLRFAYGEQFIVGDVNRFSIGTKYPVAELLLAKGIPNVWQSAYSYLKIGFSLRDNVKIAPLGDFSYRVYGGKVTNTLPFTFLENHPGNDYYYYNPGAFSLMYRYEYLSDQFAGINLEHHFGSGLFRFTSLTRKLKWRQFWNVKTLWGSLSDENNALNNISPLSPVFKTLNGQTYMELGTGIDNIFKLLRFDFVWRVFPTPLPEKRASRFGVFGSLQFQF